MKAKPDLASGAFLDRSIAFKSLKTHAWRNISLLPRKQERQPSIEPELEAWLQRKGLSTQKVELANYDNEGRGLRAFQGIGKNEQLLKIPHSALLTVERAAEISDSLGLGRNLPAWSLFAIALCDARFGRGNELSAYARALPNNSGCILEWTDEEIALLRGSAAARQADAICQANAASLEELKEPITRAEADGNLEKTLLSDGRLQWAFSMLLSRLVRLPGLGNAEALCPWADMINHDCSATAHLDFDTSQRCAALTTDRSYKPGEQVMASYGQKTSAELLLSYGFRPATGSNPHDACPLRLSISEDDPQCSAKVDLLRKYGLSSPQSFPLQITGYPNGLLQYAAFSEVELENPGELSELADWLFRIEQFPSADGVDTKILGMEVVKGICKDQLKGLAATETSKQTPEVQATNSQHRRLDDIKQIKTQEKRILDRTVFVLQQSSKSMAS